MRGAYRLPVLSDGDRCPLSRHLRLRGCSPHHRPGGPTPRQGGLRFTKPDDKDGQSFARRLGAVWTGDSLVRPPVALDAAIIFAPVGPLVVEALKSIAKGGTVVCAGIHMSDIPAFPYYLLWEEPARSVRLPT